MFGYPVKREPGLRNDRCFILKCFATFEPLKKVRSSRVSQLLGPQGLHGELPYTITFCSVDRSQKPMKFPPLGRQALVVAKLLVLFIIDGYFSKKALLLQCPLLWSNNFSIHSLTFRHLCMVSK